MPQPARTTLPDAIGLLQSFPFDFAMRECRELNHINTYYIYNEGQCRLERMLIDPTNPVELKLAEELYDGIRIICRKGISYTTMAMSKKNHDTLEQAYDRAMGIIGKR